MPLKWTRIHFLKGQITDHPNSSLTKSLDALDNFERGATAIVLEVSLLRAQVRGFVTVNELLSRRQRKQKKKKKKQDSSKRVDVYRRYKKCQGANECAWPVAGRDTRVLRPQGTS